MILIKDDNEVIQSLNLQSKKKNLIVNDLGPMARIDKHKARFDSYVFALIKDDK